MVDMTKQETPQPDLVKEAVDRLAAATKARERALATVHRATEVYETAVEAEKRAQEERDDAIRTDTRHHTVLARIAGVSRGRVGQIKSKAPEK